MRASCPVPVLLGQFCNRDTQMKSRRPVQVQEYSEDKDYEEGYDGVLRIQLDDTPLLPHRNIPNLGFL
jgi:hypothetical protein